MPRKPVRSSTTRNGHAMCQSHVLRLLDRSQRQISTDTPAVGITPTASLQTISFRSISRYPPSMLQGFIMTHWTQGQNIRKAAISSVVSHCIEFCTALPFWLWITFTRFFPYTGVSLRAKDIVWRSLIPWKYYNITYRRILVDGHI
jgi:hypothetical protein